MDKQELIEKIEKLIQDKNYYINSRKGTEEQVCAWEYSRANLQIVLKMARTLD